MIESATYPLAQRWSAELLGTFWLVLGGCGTAIFAAAAMSADAPAVNVGWLGVAFAFGLTVLTGAYAFGPVSGGHFNPAVTVGLVLARRFPPRDLPGYVGAQVAGATIAGAVLLAIAKGVGAASTRSRPASPRTATATGPRWATTWSRW